MVGLRPTAGHELFYRPFRPAGAGHRF